MKHFVAFTLALLATVAVAHPGVGIVQDSRGNVYFTDLTQVWKIAPDGRMSVAVPNVHTHELCVDAQDNVFGEHLWYEGDATKRWSQRVWRRKADGTVSDVVTARKAFEENDSFVRDAASNMYWASVARPQVIRKKGPSGVLSTHATADFRDIRWITSTPDGVLFLIDAGDLRRVDKDGRVTTLAAKLSTKTPPPQNVVVPHYHQGLWTDKEDNVYVAISEEKAVVRVGPGGAPHVVARTGPDWSPSGGLVDRDGRLWLLEYNQSNVVRVVRLGSDGHQQVFNAPAH